MSTTNRPIDKALFDVLRVAAATYWKRPSRERVTAMQKAVKDSEELSKYLDLAEPKGSGFQAQIASQARASERLKKRLQHEQQEKEEARAMARRLWNALPGEVKVDIFESSEPWLPEWLRPGADQSLTEDSGVPPSDY